MSVLLLILASALADDGLDGHHFRPVPTFGGPLDLVETWTVAEQKPRSFGVSGLIDASGASMVQVYEDWNGATETPLLSDVVALNLGVRASLSKRLALTASAPVYLTSTGVDGPQGAGLGDVRLAAPVVLIDEDGPGLTLGLVPLVDLPTGNAALLLGESGLGIGALAAAGWSTGRATVDMNLGYRHTPQFSFENHTGGGALLSSLGAGFAFNSHIAIRAEGVYENALAMNDVPGTDSPGEALLSLRGNSTRGLNWTVGGGAGFTAGAGAPDWRAFGGVGWAYINDPNRDPDLDGILGETDTCPREPEVKNGWSDLDGCPDALSNWALTVVDDEGTRLGGATVELDGVTLVTEADGTLKLTDRMPDQALSGSVSAPGYARGPISVDHLNEGSNSQTLTLAWLPGTVRLLARDNAGKPIAATVAVMGKSELPSLALSETGRLQTVLPPGDWQLLASAPGFGTEGRQISLSAEMTTLTRVEFTLKPPMVDVQKKEVVISEAVLFDFNTADLRADAEPILRQVAGVLLEHPELKRVEIAGHTDDVGEAAYNLDLSQRRVETVRTWLINNGVAADRLVAKGYGETAPIRSNGTETGKAANRRVQFMILEQDKK